MKQPYRPLHLLVLVALVAQPAAAPITPTAVAESFIACVGGSDAKCARDLFHFPGTDAERQTDREYLVYAIALFAAELGAPKDAVVRQVDGPFVSAGTGTLPYWQKHPEFTRVHFAV